MSRQPAPPSGVSLHDLRRGVVTVSPSDGTQERRRKRSTFKVCLLQWVSAGGVCDLLDADRLENSPVSSFPRHVRDAALGRRASVSAPPIKHPVLGEDSDVEPMFSPDEPGYCYLDFVREDARNRAVDKLGHNPWKPHVAAWLLDNVSVHSSRKFRVDLFADRAGGFMQMHVVASDDGISWQEALALGPVHTRIGAAPGPTMTSAMQSAEVHGKPTVLELKPRGPGVVIPIPFGFVIDTNGGGDRAKFNPVTSRGVGKITQYFESAELVSLSIAAIVHEGGPTTLFRLAITPFVDPPNGNFQWITGAHSILLSGNSQTGTAAELSLPATHQFGRQLKGAVVGNSLPCVHAQLTSPGSAYAFVKGLLEVRVSGSGIPESISVGTYKITSAASAAMPFRAQRRISPGASSQTTARVMDGETVVDTEEEDESD